MMNDVENGFEPMLKRWLKHYCNEHNVEKDVVEIFFPSFYASESMIHLAFMELYSDGARLERQIPLHVLAPGMIEFIDVVLNGADETMNSDLSQHTPTTMDDSSFHDAVLPSDGAKANCSPVVPSVSRKNVVISNTEVLGEDERDDGILTQSKDRVSKKEISLFYNTIDPSKHVKVGAVQAGLRWRLPQRRN